MTSDPDPRQRRVGVVCAVDGAGGVGGAGVDLLSDTSAAVTGATHPVDCAYNIVGMLPIDAAEPIREMLAVQRSGT